MTFFSPSFFWQGGAKVQEAFYIFQELSEKYTTTVMLINGSAVCQMHMGQFEEAETRLVEALNRVKFLKHSYY
jgi:coatomer protein complex subunit epsilon